MVTALDADPETVGGAAAWVGRCWRRTRRQPEAGGKATRLLATGWRCPSPTGCFDKVIAAEVFEHVPDDAAVLAELARVLRPEGPDRSNGAPLVPRRDQLGALGGVPQHGRRPRPHLPTSPAVRPPAPGRSRAIPPPPRARPAQPLLVATLRDRPQLRAQPRRAGIPPPPGLGHNGQNPLTRWPEAVLNPVLGKSLVIYARKVLSPSSRWQRSSERPGG